MAVWLYLLVPLAVLLVVGALLERRTRRARIPADLRRNNRGHDDKAVNEATARLEYGRAYFPHGQGGA